MSLVRAATIRALRTAIQTVIPSLGVGLATDWATWEAILITVAGASALSFLQGILAGLPEAE